MRFWFYFIFGLTNTIAFSQTVLDIPLRPYFKPEPIKENNIQSLIVFLDVYGESIDGIQRNGKILEVEFDSIGNMSYRLSADRARQNSFLNYTGNYRVEYFEFDNRGNLHYLYRENNDEIYQLSRKYDDEGNLLQSTSLVHDTVGYNHQFKWENGKMIEHIDLNEKEESDKSNFIFDDLGRIVEINRSEIQVLYDNDQIGDTVNVTETVHDSKVTLSVETYAYHQNLKEHYTHYTSTNEEGVLDQKMDVVYDDSGNAISYYLYDRNGHNYRSDQTLVKQYQIENVYDERNLLIARKFYSTKNGIKNGDLVRVERYVYDNEPLIVQFEKGEILENYGNY